MRYSTQLPQSHENRGLSTCSVSLGCSPPSTCMTRPKSRSAHKVLLHCVRSFQIGRTLISFKNQQLEMVELVGSRSFNAFFRLL